MSWHLAGAKPAQVAASHGPGIQPGPACGTTLLTSWTKSRGRPNSQCHNSLLARTAPSTNALSLAHWIDGWTLALKGPCEKPQSVPAITFSRPTSLASRTMRCATSSGCSIKLVAWVTTPGTSVAPSGSVTFCHTVHACAWRTCAASNRYAPALNFSKSGCRYLIGMSVLCGPCQLPQQM